jgi:hypothetical protein
VRWLGLERGLAIRLSPFPISATLAIINLYEDKIYENEKNYCGWLGISGVIIDINYTTNFICGHNKRTEFRTK